MDEALTRDAKVRSASSAGHDARYSHHAAQDAAAVPRCMLTAQACHEWFASGLMCCFWLCKRLQEVLEVINSYSNANGGDQVHVEVEEVEGDGEEAGEDGMDEDVLGDGAPKE